MVECRIDETVKRLMSGSIDPFFMTGGSRQTQDWAKAKSALTTSQECRYLESACAEACHAL